jgi:hypothetical protein
MGKRRRRRNLNEREKGGGGMGVRDEEKKLIPFKVCTSKENFSSLFFKSARAALRV